MPSPGGRACFPAAGHSGVFSSVIPAKVGIQDQEQGPWSKVDCVESLAFTRSGYRS
jgi:hypothetical protein